MTTLGMAVFSAVLTLGIWGHSFSLIPDLFKLNKECQEEGYYMAEFEFKMLGFAYLLDKGQIVDAASGVRRYHAQLKKREGLINVPKFADKREEMEFYLNLQNPRTGAFMDDSFPYCTYEGPTGNVLLHLENLAEDTGQPLRLKYPLRFFDKINTPVKLKAYLDDLAYIGWLASKLPESSFHLVRDLISYTRDDELVYRHGLYSFSPEWKHAMLEWFYDNQDPETGFWGPRSRSNGKLLKLDLHNTASIVKSFVQEGGADLHPEFPLRYREKMFATTLRVLSQPVPVDFSLDEWHGYRLARFKGIMLLTRYLWQDAGDESKQAARQLYEDYIRLVFEKNYIPVDRAFSYYPGSQHATMDGTGDAISALKALGVLDPDKQRHLWGGVHATCGGIGTRTVAGLSVRDFAPFTGQEINSVRLYAGVPDTSNLLENVAGVFYPCSTVVRDIAELVPGIQSWLDTTSLSMGNWVSKEVIVDNLAHTVTGPVPVPFQGIPLEAAAGILQEHNVLTVIGFDVLQIPRRIITFTAGGA